MFLKVNAAKSINVANKLSEIPEIKCVHLITGKHNIIVKLMIAEGEQTLQDHLISLKFERIHKNKNWVYGLESWTSYSRGR